MLVTLATSPLKIVDEKIQNQKVMDFLYWHMHFDLLVNTIEFGEVFMDLQQKRLFLNSLMSLLINLKLITI